MVITKDLYDYILNSELVPDNLKNSIASTATEEQWVFIGSDFSGQENVNLSHYLHPIDNGRLDRIINEGSKEDGTDLHSLNAKVCNVSRGDAKAIFFGKLYGSSPTLTGFTILGDKHYDKYTEDEYKDMEEKLAKRTVEIEANSGIKYYPIKKGQLVVFDKKLVVQAIFGKHIQSALTDNTEGLAELEELMKEFAEKHGYIELPMGRKVYIDSTHKALNYYNQGLGGMAFKVYLRLFYTSLKALGINIGEHYRLQACIYDEIDIIASPVHADTIVSVMNSVYKLTSDELGLAVSYSGETLVGPDWASCH